MSNKRYIEVNELLDYYWESQKEESQSLEQFIIYIISELVEEDKKAEIEYIDMSKVYEQRLTKDQLQSTINNVFEAKINHLISLLKE